MDKADAAVLIQSRFRGHAARRAIRKQNDAATKIQAVHRGRSVRRDLDSRSSSRKKADSAAVLSDLEEMKARMEKMSVKMDVHEQKQDKELLRRAQAHEGGGDTTVAPGRSFD